VLTLGVSIVVGLVPAWRASRRDVNSTLKEAGRGAGARGPHDLVRSTLIGAEVALALVLLVGAGLLIRSAVEMQRVDPGFDPQGVFTGRVLLSTTKYGDPLARLAVSEHIEAAIAALPGVTAAALASRVPGVPGFSNGLLPEGTAASLASITQTDGFMVTPDFFATLRLPVVRGRAFTEADRAGSPPVVIINETAARRMWPGQDPLGKRLTSANPRGATTVIGIAADVRARGVAQPAAPTFYIPLAQLEEEAWRWAPTMYVAVRTPGDPASLGPAVRRVIAAIDPGIPLFSTSTMEERMGSMVAVARFNTTMLVLLGAAGLLLAAIGIYGVIAFFAAQRTSEIGMRMALGASRGDVIRMVVREAAIPVLGGIATGAAGAVLAAQALSTQLVNVRPTDPLTFVTVAVGLLLIALIAAIIPARRAASLSPVKALQAN
jgi:putative ABC transport system permease protein